MHIFKYVYCTIYIPLSWMAKWPYRHCMHLVLYSRKREKYHLVMFDIFRELTERERRVSTPTGTCSSRMLAKQCSSFRCASFEFPVSRCLFIPALKSPKASAELIYDMICLNSYLLLALASLLQLSNITIYI